MSTVQNHISPTLNIQLNKVFYPLFPHEEKVRRQWHRQCHQQDISRTPQVLPWGERCVITASWMKIHLKYINIYLSFGLQEAAASLYGLFVKPQTISSSPRGRALQQMVRPNVRPRNRSWNFLLLIATNGLQWSPEETRRLLCHETLRDFYPRTFP